MHMCKVPLSQGWETCDFWIFHSNRVWPLSLPVCSLKVSTTVSQHQPLPSVLEPWAQSTGEKESQDKASGRNPASPCPDSPWPQPPSHPVSRGPAQRPCIPPGPSGIGGTVGCLLCTPSSRSELLQAGGELGLDSPCEALSLLGATHPAGFKVSFYK